MSRITALLVGIAGLTFVSTSLVSAIAEARDGCGRGFYYNGRRCVPQYDPGYDYRYRSYPRREPGVSVDVGPNLRAAW